MTDDEPLFYSIIYHYIQVAMLVVSSFICCGRREASNLDLGSNGFRVLQKINCASTV